MKTTLDIPDELFHRAKNAALERRTSLKAIVNQALERFLGPESNVVTPLHTHVWPPEGTTNTHIESENILQIIRNERENGGCRGLEKTRAAGKTPTSKNQASKSARKVRK
jgi:hypothetical protein